MSATEWKPGDVALRVSPYSERSFVSLRVNGCTGVLGHLPHWHFVAEGVSATQCGEDGLAEYRPLVVLDPENAEDVQRLADLFMRESVYPTTDALNVAVSIKAALRELASPTPPKPDEPTGLGAVMEDKAGCLWIRSGASHVSPNWRRCGEDEWHDYDDIDAVRVLSEGVPE